MCFLVALCQLLLRKPNLEVATSAAKNIKVALVSCNTWKSVPRDNSGGVNIS